MQIDGCSLMVSEAKYETTQGKGLKLLTPKPMHQVPIALGQVKSDDTSKNLLNKIHQIKYYLYEEFGGSTMSC